MNVEGKQGLCDDATFVTVTRMRMRLARDRIIYQDPRYPKQAAGVEIK
jgi:hypothetical protein